MKIWLEEPSKPGLGLGRGLDGRSLNTWGVFRVTADRIRLANWIFLQEKSNLTVAGKFTQILKLP
jgi:hypothetical protein